MRFNNVSVAAVAHVDAPVRLTSTALMARLQLALERLDVRPELLEQVAGIRERRLWGQPTPVAEVAAVAGERVLQAAGIPRASLGLLVSTSVCRDYIEPSTASVVHGASVCPTPARTSTWATPASPFSTAWTSPGA